MNDSRKFDYSIKTLLVGATALAAGYCHAIASSSASCDCAVIDSGVAVGFEFADALKSDGNIVSENSFYDEATARGIITSYGEHLPAYSPLCSFFFVKSGAILLPEAKITSIESIEDGFCVSFFSLGSTYLLFCERIIDTTTDGETVCFFKHEAIDLSPRSVAQNGILIFSDTPAVLPEISGAKLWRGAFDDEIFISLPIPPNTPHAEARRRLYDFVSAQPALDGCKIAFVANTYDTQPGLEFLSFGNKAAFCPSAARKNAPAAFAYGERIATNDISNHMPTQTVAPSSESFGDFDVIIAGMGTAGGIAALICAENGLSTLCIEKLCCVGGTSTVGGILMYYCGIIGGEYEKIHSRAKELSGDPLLIKYKYPSELAKKFAYDEAVSDAADKLCVLFGTTVTGVLTDSKDAKTVTGIRFQNKDGFFTATAKYVLDCTANADLCIGAGCEMLGGRDSDGSFQPYSNLEWKYNAGKGIAYFHNIDSGTVNQYIPHEFGEAVLTSALSVDHLPDKFTKDEPRMLGTTSLLGLREGKRIVGEYVMRFSDLIEEKLTSRPVFWGYSNIDNHGKDNPFESRACRDWNAVCSMWEYRLTFPVDGGALIPRGIHGLLAAGRNISVDHTLASALRMKLDAEKSGEVAARLIIAAISEKCDVRCVDYNTLCGKLLESGCIKPSTRFRMTRIESPPRVEIEMNAGFESVYCSDTERIKSGLSGSSESGYYVLCAYMKGKSDADFAQMLTEWTEATSFPLSQNSALALGLIGSKKAIPTLLSMAKSSTLYTPRNGRCYNYPHSLAAISLLGRMKAAEAFDFLCEIIKTPGYGAEQQKTVSTASNEFICDGEDLAFQYFLHALCALREICEDSDNASLYAKAKECIISRVFAKDFSIRVSLKATANLKTEYGDKIKSYVMKYFA